MDKRFLVGLDLGQVNDFSAVAALERTLAPPEALAHYTLKALSRVKGVPYPTVVGKVKALVARPEFRPVSEYRLPASAAVRHDVAPEPTLVIDATGVGRGVTDMFFAAKPAATLVPTTITAGSSARTEFTQGRRHWYVPKKDLVAAVLAALQTGRLHIPNSLEHAETLKRELLDFRVKVTASANDVFNAREGQHDDLLLAVALAVWYGDTGGRAAPLVVAPSPVGSTGDYLARLNTLSRRNRPYGPRSGTNPWE